MRLYSAHLSSADGASVAGIGDPGRMATLDQPGSAIPATIRATWRAFALMFFSACALVEIAITIPFVRRARRNNARAQWLHRWCWFACRVLGIRLAIRGTIPRAGLLVCNHLSYLDIIALSSIRSCVFVAKHDVAAWPLFGWLARSAGTIFVDRHRKLAARAAVDLTGDAIAGGSLVVLFPEGTSSDGRSVLPFKPALLEAAVQMKCPITVGAIDYSLSDGSVADEVCYWRDMTLVLHLLNLFTKANIKSMLSLARFESRDTDRKQLALELRREIIRLRS